VVTVFFLSLTALLTAEESKVIAASLFPSMAGYLVPDRKRLNASNDGAFHRLFETKISQ
jgi:hypothetical protein